MATLKQRIFAGVSELLGFIRIIFLLLSPRRFWMVYLFCIFAFLQFILFSVNIDALLIKDYKLFLLYPLNQVTGTVLFIFMMWLLVFILFLRSVHKKLYEPAMLYFIHFITMPLYVERIAFFGFGLFWGGR